MVLSCFILALSVSIDSLSIGITYGIKNTKISYIGKVTLFITSFVISIISIWFGDSIKNIFPEFFTKLIGTFILIFMGIFIIYQSINKRNLDNLQCKNIENIDKEKIYSFFIKFLGVTIQIIKNPISSDFDNSKKIDAKEALFLGLALSLDAFCVGIGSGIMGINSCIFPFLTSLFQLIFLNTGILFGKKLNSLSKLPDNIWSIISGSLLIIIGLIKVL
jgi:putative sporulation protein YtaF